MKKIIFIVFQIVIIYSYSQNIVLDNTTKQTIPNVNITIKNTNKGFASDKNGVFYIDKNLKLGDVLIFSAIGFQTKEITYKNKKQLKQIELQRKTEQLNEVMLSVKSPKREIVKLGVLKSKKSAWRILGTNAMIATYIKPLNNRDDGIIKSLILKKLKVNFNGSYNIGTLNKPKFKNFKFKNTVAVKLQLYPIDDRTQWPDTTKPLINNDMIIVLNLNTRKLELNIENYYISMPKEGVFITLSIEDVYDTNSKIKSLKHSHILSYNISGEKDKATSYYKWNSFDYLHRDEGNAIFSLEVAYPIKK